ncbi:hypothetical protein [Jeotgalibacillus marinus]|uniref:Uncharacterized protein n=1 Tax=Jeotgalibacillus marinus TaxID=86667 RepID=A0ABV3Q1A1_9BACL
MAGLQRWSQRFYQYGNLYVLLSALAIFTIFITIILPSEAETLAAKTSSNRSPDTTLFYSAEELYDIAEEYGDEGRAAYVHSRYTFDVVWPLAFTFFLTAGMSFFFRPLTFSKWKLINLLPIVGMLFDFLENTAASIVMLRFPSTTHVIALFTPFFTLQKWLFIFASFTLLFVALIYRVIHTIKKRKSL